MLLGTGFNGKYNDTGINIVHRKRNSLRSTIRCEIEQWRLMDDCSVMFASGVVGTVQDLVAIMLQTNLKLALENS